MDQNTSSTQTEDSFLDGNQNASVRSGVHSLRKELWLEFSTTPDDTSVAEGSTDLVVISEGDLRERFFVDPETDFKGMDELGSPLHEELSTRFIANESVVYQEIIESTQIDFHQLMQESYDQHDGDDENDHRVVVGVAMVQPISEHEIPLPPYQIDQLKNGKQFVDEDLYGVSVEQDQVISLDIFDQFDDMDPLPTTTPPQSSTETLVVDIERFSEQSVLSMLNQQYHL